MSSASTHPQDPRIIHHGARHGVTGSCHELRLDDEFGVLVDCGLFQGDEARARERSVEGRGDADADPLAIDFPSDHIKALILTHVHIDHCGRLPWLLAAGFNGPIFCSQPSATLLPIMLEDAFKIGVSRNRRLVEAYLGTVRRMLVPVPYGEWRAIGQAGQAALSFRLQPAGHILGSAYVEVQTGAAARGGRRSGTRLLFSGDLGAPYAPILPAPKPAHGADVVVLESTYGDRIHEGRRTRIERLQAIIERALGNGGTLLIPAFALGRTQELLYELEGIIHANRGRRAAKGLPWDDLEIVLDSPLAGRVTEAFGDMKGFWDAEAKERVRRGRRPLTFEQLTPVESHGSHLHTVEYLKHSGRPCIVIAASGMCTGGRIVNYLKALVGDPRTDLLFVGYQAHGTPGRAIQTYGPEGGWVELEGTRYTIRAGVHTISGYSAHADQQNLVGFVSRMRRQPKEVRLVHGDQDARQALAVRLRDALPGTEVVV
jgi:metallo-beta-lactamase family protein